MTRENAKANYDKAQSAVRVGESKGLSEQTMNRKWSAFFRAEDAFKAISKGVRYV